MLVNGSLGYVGMSRNNQTRIYFHASGFSSPFGKLHNFFDDPTWKRYVAVETEPAYRHGCFLGPPCFSDTQDMLDVLTPLTKQLLEKLGAYFKQVQPYYTDDLQSTRFFYRTLERASWGNETGKVHALRLIERCDLFSDSSLWYCKDGVECSVQVVNQIMGSRCDEAKDETDEDEIRETDYIRQMTEDAWQGSQLPGGTSNRCFHNFLIRYSNYSAEMYESFVDALGRYLLLELDMVGFCSPIAEIKEPFDGLSERRRKTHEATRGTAKKLLEGKRLLEIEGAGKFKSWSELAREVARSAVDELAKGKDLPYPSSDDALETFKKIGESIRSFPFNTESFSFDNVVYQPASDNEEHCVLKYNNDTAEEVRYKNVNYVVSRCRKY